MALPFIHCIVAAISASLLCFHVESVVPAIYAVGDDLLDTGNRPYINTTLTATFPPFGETYFGQPTGRSTDGRIVIDFIADFFRLPFLPPYLDRKANKSYGTSFATSVTTAIANTTVPVGQVTITDQLKYLTDLRMSSIKKRDSAEETWKFAEALYVVSLGITDYKAYLDYSYLQRQYGILEYVSVVVESIEDTIKHLINVVGVKKLLVFGVEAFGCRPVAKYTALIYDSSYAGDGCYLPANQIAQLHNTVLGQSLALLRSEYPNVTLLEASIYDLNINIVNDPASYRFLNSTGACCGGGPFNGGQLCAQQETFLLGGVLAPSNFTAELCPDPSLFVYFNLNFFSDRFNYIMATEILLGSSVYPFQLAKLAIM